MSSSPSTHPSVVHDTIVVERRFPVPVATVFTAFADAEQRARWHFLGEDWELVEFEQDFRVGGREHSRFGPKGEANLREEGIFLDIIENTRIVSCGTMHQDDMRMSCTLCTVEFTSDRDGTRLKLTVQSAFFDGRERPDERRAGWGKVLRRLDTFLTSSRPTA